MTWRAWQARLFSCWFGFVGTLSIVGFVIAITHGPIRGQDASGLVIALITLPISYGSWRLSRYFFRRRDEATDETARPD
jgi:hypothetical protein